MASKVQPAADYWTDDVKLTSKVQPAAGYWTFDRVSICHLILLGTTALSVPWSPRQQQGESLLKAQQRQYLLGAHSSSNLKESLSTPTSETSLSTCMLSISLSTKRPEKIFPSTPYKIYLWVQQGQNYFSAQQDQMYLRAQQSQIISELTKAKKNLILPHLGNQESGWNILDLYKACLLASIGGRNDVCATSFLVCSLGSATYVGT